MTPSLIDKIANHVTVDLALPILSKDIQLTVSPVTSRAAGMAFLKAVPSSCLSFLGDNE